MTQPVFHRNKTFSRLTVLLSANFVLACGNSSQGDPNAIVSGAGERTASVSAAFTSSAPQQPSAKAQPSAGSSSSPSSGSSAGLPLASGSASLPATVSSSAASVMATLSASATQTPSKYSNWREVTDPPLGLKHCSENPSNNEQSCNYSLDCDDTEIVTHCSLEADGSWACDCTGSYQTSGGSHYSGYSMKITGGDASNACLHGRMACIDGSLTGAKRTCSSRATPSGFDCQLTESCDIELMFPDKALATISTEQSINCYGTGGVGFCQCTNGKAFTLNGASGAALCSKGQEFCDLPLNTDGPIECWEPRSVSDASSCSTFWDCGTKTTGSDPKVYVTSTTNGSAVYCNKSTASQAWECTCQPQEDAPAYLSVNIAGLGASCNVAAEVCAEGYKPAPKGDVVCDAMTTTLESTGSKSCHGRSVCFQSLDTQSGAAKVGATLETQCDKAEDNSYKCRCGQESSTFTLSANSITVACENALSPCAKRASFTVASDGQVTFSFAPVTP